MLKAALGMKLLLSAEAVPDLWEPTALLVTFQRAIAFHPQSVLDLLIRPKLLLSLEAGPSVAELVGAADPCLLVAQSLDRLLEALCQLRGGPVPEHEVFSAV